MTLDRSDDAAWTQDPRLGAQEERAVQDTQALAADMKAAMRRLAKSVVVITTRHEGRRLAMSATAVDSLCMEPPSLIACVNKNASIFPALVSGSRFCVNILSRDHEELALWCGGQRKGESRFERGDWREHPAGVPYLEDAQAAIVCVQDGAFHYGTHGVFVGRVLDIRVGGEVAPLIYADARYGGAAF